MPLTRSNKFPHRRPPNPPNFNPTKDASLLTWYLALEVCLHLIHALKGGVSTRLLLLLLLTWHRPSCRGGLPCRQHPW